MKGARATVRTRGTNADLRYYYKVANKLCFRNKLPVVPVRFGNIRHLGSTRVLEGVPYSIIISKRLQFSSKLTVMTLIHEMCHVEFPERRGHGWRFDKRMRKIAAQGGFDGLW